MTTQKQQKPKVEGHRWYEDHDELVAFAFLLDGVGAFNEVADVLRFFEKPWNWTDEYVAWLDAGRPCSDEASDELRGVLLT